MKLVFYNNPTADQLMRFYTSLALIYGIANETRKIFVALKPHAKKGKLECFES